jgi:hypothetical protein
MGMANTQNLSPEALNILINMQARQGATPKGRNPADALAELQRAGILGADYGLTRAGLNARTAEYARRLDVAFS